MYGPYAARSKHPTMDMLKSVYDRSQHYSNNSPLVLIESSGPFIMDINIKIMYVLHII